MIFLRGAVGLITDLLFNDVANENLLTANSVGHVHASNFEPPLMVRKWRRGFGYDQKIRDFSFRRRKLRTAFKMKERKEQREGEREREWEIGFASLKS